MHIIGAGFDTLGMTLSSVLVWIGRNPRCQAKLHEELDKARRDGKADDVPTHAQTLALPYLQSCITEAMRLTPVIGISLPRVVPSGGTLIDGHHIPSGTVVGMNPWIIHRDKGIFGEDAEDFRPERYLEAGEPQRHAMEAASLSWGGASRSCPGRNLAMLALGKTCAALFMEFEVEILEGGEGGGEREECFFVVKWYGVWMRLKARN
jgi:cytochrome P450